jgi:hypothetical protein
MSKKRNKRITAYCNDEEFKEIKALSESAGVPVGRYLREVALGWRRSGNAENLTGEELNMLFVNLSTLSNEMVRIADAMEVQYMDYNEDLEESIPVSLSGKAEQKIEVKISQAINLSEKAINMIMKSEQ